jgi:2-polyprenyl-6-methoxyphenol hydroxylase-like FAD-dependent oxidoreductase
MEIFRRLGLAKAIRAIGLPDDYPNDVCLRTTMTGIELARTKIPCRNERYTAKDGPDGWWPTPEPPHRVNQIFLEPLLSAHAAAQSGLRILDRVRLEEFVQKEAGVVATVRDLGCDETFSIACDYLVGCDGGKSTIRKRIGAKLEGAPIIQRVQSTYLRAPGLLSILPGTPAWLYQLRNPRRCGTVFAIDGRETWIVHNFLDEDEDTETIDRNWAIRTILGVDRDFRYEVISKEDWVGRRLVADRFCDRRVFLCGDAAHIWIPYAGYGMNAGIADAADLSWMLAATLRGWGSPAMLDAYEAERHDPLPSKCRISPLTLRLEVPKGAVTLPQRSKWQGPPAMLSARLSAGKPAISTSNNIAAAGSTSAIFTIARRSSLMTARHNRLTRRTTSHLRPCLVAARPICGCTETVRSMTR